MGATVRDRSSTAMALLEYAAVAVRTRIRAEALRQPALAEMRLPLAH